MNRTNVDTLAVIALMAGLTGCTIFGGKPPPPETADTQPVGDLQYTVRPGDQLGNIALETTDSLNNWRVIADYNGIDDPQLLRPGDVLNIPRALIDQTAATQAADNVKGAEPARALPSVDEPVAVAVQKPPTTPVSLPRAETDITEVTLTAIADRPAPVEAQRHPKADSPGARGVTRSVEVSGSYYPRGIYAEPSGSARLIMRATPGVLLPLERTIDNWYRVTTSQGTGYIRASDARIVDSSATPGSTASSD